MRKTAVINFEEVMNYSKVRKNLVPVLENEKNVSEKVYSFDYLEDLKITFRIRFRDGVSVVVTEDMVKAWDCEPWDLLLDAQNNLRPKVMTLEDSIGLPEGDLPIMVLTTEEGIQGAAAILRPEGLEEISEKLGGDLVLLPSSIHDWIVLPGDADIEGSYMVQMVRSINQTVVEPEDRLSDNVYVWRSRTGLIELLEG